MLMKDCKVSVVHIRKVPDYPKIKNLSSMNFDPDIISKAQIQSSLNKQNVIAAKKWKKV